MHRLGRRSIIRLIYPIWAANRRAAVEERLLKRKPTALGPPDNDGPFVRSSCGLANGEGMAPLALFNGYHHCTRFHPLESLDPNDRAHLNNPIDVWDRYCSDQREKGDSGAPRRLARLLRSKSAAELLNMLGTAHRHVACRGDPLVGAADAIVVIEAELWRRFVLAPCGVRANPRMTTR